jgi:glycosyltransferase involved in cell wall biosynthesis
MKILFVAPYAPSLIRVRPYHFVRGLAARGHRIVVAAPWATRDDRGELESLREFGCETMTAPLPKWRSMLNCGMALAGSAPLQSAYCWSPELAGKIEQAIAAEPFDLIHVEHLRGARYGLRAMELVTRGAMRRSGARPRVIWDSVDCISGLFGQASERGAGPMRWLTAFEQPRTRAYEGMLASAFDRVVVTTEREAAALQRLAAPTPAPLPAAVCNGVDLDYFAFHGGLRAAETVVMTGKMSYHANVAAAKCLIEEVMPLVWQERPRVKVEIVGKNPTREALALAYPEGRAGGGRQRGQVAVTGEVLDLRPHLWRAAVAVAPIVYGAGVQNKVLEAMAASTPVVATPAAVGALQARNGKDLLVGSNPAELASHLLTLLANQDLRQRIGDAGRAFVERHHGWESAVASLESVYGDAMAPVRERQPQEALEREF